LKIWRFILLLFSHLEIENLTKPITTLATNKKFLKKKARLPRASQPAGTRNYWKEPTSGYQQGRNHWREPPTGYQKGRRVAKTPKPRARWLSSIRSFSSALSKPWGHVLRHNVMPPGKQKLVITDLGLKRAKINSYVAF
jgi:hypothetical protein